MANEKKTLQRGARLDVELQREQQERAPAQDQSTGTRRAVIGTITDDDPIYPPRAGAVTLKFFEINAAPGVYEATESEVILGVYQAAYKTWWLSLPGATEETFAAAHQGWILISDSDARGFGAGPHGVATAGASLTLEKTQAIDQSLVAGFDPELSAPLTARAGEHVAQTYALRSGLLYIAGLTQTRLKRQRAPYDQFNYSLDDQRERDLASNKMFFKDAPRSAGAIIAGDGDTWARFDTAYDPAFPSVPGVSGFKVTREPSFSADRVDLDISAGSTVEIYLKRLPRVYKVEFSVRWHFPYSFWNGSPTLLNRSETRAVWWGSQFSTTTALENWFNHGSDLRAWVIYWQAKIQAAAVAAAGVAAIKSEAAGKAEDYFEQALESNGWGDIGAGYTWPPTVYSSMVPLTEAEALAREADGDLPRYYPDIPHGYFLHHGTGGASSSRWQYDGEFLGVIIYRGARYYIWRYTTNHRSSYASRSLSHSLSMSSAAWELEPYFIYTSETDGHFNQTESDLHQVIDESRPMSAHLHFSQGGLGDFDGDVEFFFQPKYVTDFGAAPRRFQT